MIEMVGVAAPLIVALIKAAMVIRQDKKKIHHLEAQSKINQLMRNCIANTTIDRFLILKITNSANELLNGVLKRYLVSCINEEHKDIHTSVIDFYQFILVDDAYKMMVLKSYEKKFYHFVTENENDCDLKTIYEKEGIKESRIYFIHTSGKTLYFCSIAAYGYLDITFEDEKLIETAISRIRESYRAYYN